MAQNFPLGVTLTLLDRFTAPLARVGGALEGVGKKAERLGKKLSIGVTAPLAAFGALSVKTGLDFQSSMNRVEAITGATAEQMAALSKEAEGALGTDGLPFTARAAASAMAELAHSGLSVAEVEGALPGVIALSIAAHEDEAAAAKATADTLDAYGLSATRAGEVTDLLAFAALRGEQELGDLSDGVRATGATAKAFDQDLPSVIGVLNVLADAGAAGSAGASLYRKALGTLARPSGVAQKTLSRLGVTARDLFKDGGKQLRPLDDILQTLTKRGATARDAVAIFGGKGGAGQALFSLLGPGADKAKAFADQLRGAGGAATDLARVALKGGVGDLELFQQKWEKLLITVARSGLIEALGRLATKAATLLEWVSKLPTPVLETGLVLGGLAAATGPLLIGLGNVLPLLGRLLPLLSETSALGGIGGLVGKAVPWVAIGVGVAVITKNLWDLWDAVRGANSLPAGVGPNVDRPAMDAGAFPAGGAVRGRPVGAERTEAAKGRAAASGRSDVSGRVQVEFKGAPPGTRVRARQTGDVPIDVDVGYNLAAGLAG